MNRYVKTLGIAAALAAMIPLSAYAASAVPGKSGTTTGSAVVQADTTDTAKEFGKARGGKIGGGYGIGVSYVNEDVLALLKLDRDALQEKLASGSTLEEIAAEQDVSKNELKAAMTAAFEKQQSEMKQQFESNLDTMISTKHEFGDFRPGGGFGFGLEAVAQALGITKDELRTALQAEGATIASVAKENGVSTDSIIAKVKEAITVQIDQAAADGKLTSEKAAEAKEKAQEQAERLVNGQGLGHKGMEGGRGGFHAGKGERKDGSAASESAETSA
ncbi:hypothetical protein D3P07_05170 [Paenibacillus sp. 1011MAR3C5]|uniref:hypothetical protein n=1 Tax=Paenibacillus sp. 1011MAR3C5 TaxID=1675787 RepID=UPI000E6B81C7|nr:hypothetical protein [Paenibacillus sp. 1011MAR3C5]RJE89631.1 hypothetical protein D3P07_05170 [Paenibacillus sp. 1011MAR3C5]